MNTDHVVLRVVTKMLLPFILLYAFYVQLHGEHSPGGGFQAGVIAAAAFIAYALVHGLEPCKKVLPLAWVRVGASLGVLLYGGVGVVTTFMGGKYLEYGVLLSEPAKGQVLGMMLIELGVGLTVFSVMMIVFYVFAERTRK